MKLKPLYDRIIVKASEPEEKTAGGIIIPDTAKEKPMQGIIQAIGTGARSESGDRIAFDVKVGDRVLFGRFAGTTVKIDGEEFIVLKENEIFAVIE